MPTPRRFYRIAQALHQRQLDLCLALDHVHDQHNVSAVLRSCDATGIGRILWETDVEQSSPMELNPDVAKGSQHWVDISMTKDLARALQELKGKGFRVAATHMGQRAEDFRSIDWTVPFVVVMGNEQRGCRDHIAQLADVNVFLPMMGFVQSLNISVAAAVLLYEIQRQRSERGMYSQTASPDQVRELFARWQLAGQGYQIEDFLTPPSGDMPPPDAPHLDGRGIDRRKLDLPAAGRKMP